MYWTSQMSDLKKNEKSGFIGYTIRGATSSTPMARGGSTPLIARPSQPYIGTHKKIISHEGRRMVRGCPRRAPRHVMTQCKEPELAHSNPAALHSNWTAITWIFLSSLLDARRLFNSRQREGCVENGTR